jgi:transposase-like protein
MTLITGDERRRRWSDADRARILAEIEVPGAVVAEVARRAVWRDNQGETGASIWMRSGDRAF